MFQHTAARRRLDNARPRTKQPLCFNTQPPEGGWEWEKLDKHKLEMVSTHSRPKAAGSEIQTAFFNGAEVSTHSRPKAAGFQFITFDGAFAFQHTAARRRLVYHVLLSASAYLFQHTAARRRLDEITPTKRGNRAVSTHSRPKAAGIRIDLANDQAARFNTQPPEGGWSSREPSFFTIGWFQHTAARRRLGPD